VVAVNLAIIQLLVYNRLLLEGSSEAFPDPFFKTLWKKESTLQKCSTVNHWQDPPHAQN